ncbi:hypothetical protein ALC57_06085 [Trachymyrmex cornetzi]|uniref:Uncharacterized protein n=1 Tax=Trachymyrmex cornetzi TaxID=471704 RepID=A0A195E9I1_9HYME|nr:hypothetical protein ALC57_06085 [Trachymyrmex cornetzi]
MKLRLITTDVKEENRRRTSKASGRSRKGVAQALVKEDRFERHEGMNPLSVINRAGDPADGAVKEPLQGTEIPYGRGNFPTEESIKS